MWPDFVGWLHPCRRGTGNQGPGRIRRQRIVAAQEGALSILPPPDAFRGRIIIFTVFRAGIPRGNPIRRRRLVPDATIRWRRRCPLGLRIGMPSMWNEKRGRSPHLVHRVPSTATSPPRYTVILLSHPAHRKLPRGPKRTPKIASRVRRRGTQKTMGVSGGPASKPAPVGQ